MATSAKQKIDAYFANKAKSIEEVKTAQSKTLADLSDSIFLKLKSMSLEELNKLIKECRQANRFNCSWQAYYMANTIMNFAINCLNLVGR